MSAVKVSIAQINALVGDLAGNAQRVLDAARTAHAAGAKVLLTPELVLTGYPPEDLLLRPSFLEKCEQTLAQLCRDLAAFSGLHVVVGHIARQNGQLHNAASVLIDGRVLGVYYKRELPNYAVFDEKRYFVPGERPLAFTVDGVCFGVNICEDIWLEAAPEAAAQQGAHALLVLNASPYNLGKYEQRLDIARRCIARTGCSLLYSNLVGGQDELTFDGASFAMSAAAELVTRLPDYQEGLSITEVFADGRLASGQESTSGISQPALAPTLCLEAQVWQALTLCLADYVKKNGFRTVILGLSGGIDSAVVMAIAVDALGADKVHAVMMPSRYTADISQIDARDMVKRLGVAYEEIAIGGLAEQFDQVLNPLFVGKPLDATEENIQARLRGMLLMAMSNKFGHLVLTTGNKSELSTGYCTLYGDMAGGFAVLKDVAKTLVYRLARWRNEQAEVIPERIITRAPSAELRADQTDQDNLPEYEVIDAIIDRYVEQNHSALEIVAAGYPREAVEQIVRLIRINEYKRRQSPPGPRITKRAYGRDWRYPLSNGFRDTF